MVSPRKKTGKASQKTTPLKSAKTDAKAKKKPSRKTGNSKKPQKKAIARAGGGKTGQKKEVQPPFFSNEATKIVFALIVLVFIVASGAMLADIYFGSQAEVMREGGEVQENIPLSDKKRVRDAAIEKSITDDYKIKKPLEDLKQKVFTDEKPINPNRALAKKEGEKGELKKSVVIKRDMDKPLYELFNNSHAPEKYPRKPVKDLLDGYPGVAIIIDDIGFDKKLAYDLLAIDSNITFSILPFAPFGRSIAEHLNSMGAEIMLHLPMEPNQYPNVDPGPGAILAAMSPDVLLENLRNDLDAIPHVKGVNNHMGSRITSLSPQMRQIFTVLKQRDLFFIDSLTSKKSLCRSSARLFRLPFAQRDIFLDNIQEETYIRGQLGKLVRMALRHGTAVGIGHPYKATLDSLKKEMPGIRKRVNIVPASALVSIP